MGNTVFTRVKSKLQIPKWKSESLTTICARKKCKIIKQLRQRFVSSLGQKIKKWLYGYCAMKARHRNTGT